MRAFETTRLALRAFDKADLSQIAAWYEPPDPTGAQEFLKYCFKEYKDRGVGPWAMVLKESAQIVGHCGFPHVDLDQNMAEVNYFVAPQHRRKGLATEGLRGLLDFGFHELGFTRIQGRCELANAASERVLQEAAMKFEQIIESPNSDPARLYFLESPGG